MSDRAFRALLVTLAGAYALFVALPLAALLLRAAPDRLLAALGEPIVWSAVGLSLITATVTTLLALLGATPAAYLLTGATGRWRRGITVLLELPLVLPPAVAGLALILAFGRYQLLGPLLARLGVEQVAMTPAAIVMAQLLVAGPLHFRAARAAFEQVPARLRQASAVLGASEATTVRRVVLPLAAKGLLAGLLLTWARAIGELGATLLFAGSLPGRTLTMPSAIFIRWNRNLDEAIALAVILLLLALGAMLLARRVAGEAAR